MFFATFHGTHVGDGGPVPSTNKATASDYVYVLRMNGEDTIEWMTKIWNAPGRCGSSAGCEPWPRCSATSRATAMPRRAMIPRDTARPLVSRTGRDGHGSWTA